MTRHKILVFDFDGTMTDAEEEGANFRENYLKDLAILTGLDPSTVFEQANAIELDMTLSPQKYGFRLSDPRIACPSNCDPYLRIQPVAHQILTENVTFNPPEFLDRLLGMVLYKHHYARFTKTAFRTGAYELLHAARNGGYQVYIVTNSDPTEVKRKIHLLGEQSVGLGIRVGGWMQNGTTWLLNRTFGDAKKFLFTDDRVELPESMEIPGLERPVWLRRGHYANVLQSILDQHDATWKDLTVVGDIFELDLALPMAMGARVGLVTNENTPQYEVDFLESDDPRTRDAFTAVDLEEVRFNLLDL